MGYFKATPLNISMVAKEKCFIAYGLWKDWHFELKNPKSIRSFLTEISDNQTKEHQSLCILMFMEMLVPMLYQTICFIQKSE